ncbi:MAG TPA: thiamine pyrophosphate-dependent enzyme [Thermoanaerobaculia bacterium]|nr:thiamine pyrophosphate-dependent enzyme [Thermoanaerobaculia bacterium]
MAVDTGTESIPEAPPTEAPRTDRATVLADYRVACVSREASLLGRREVLTGKAKFGIFGDGKEVAQIAMAKACRPGDWRAGYYRDQTVMLALGLVTVEELFAQLYAHADPAADPSSAGRQMNAHFATRFVSSDGVFADQLAAFNSSADLSPTGSQMPRLVGLAYASRLYRELPELRAPDFARFSRNGDEIAFGTIGNASTAEGMFWEAINAVGVLGAPLLMSIWDDGYGISVSNEHQVCKQDLSEVLWGFQRHRDGRQGYDLHTVRGWDYPALVECYVQAAAVVRREHVPAIVHVVELTQPQGHSTSGSHERYKSRERLAWEEEWDGLRQMRRWAVAEGLAGDDELDAIEREARAEVREAQQRAWDAHRRPLDEERRAVVGLLGALADAAEDEETAAAVAEVRRGLERKTAPFRRELVAAARDALLAAHEESGPALDAVAAWEAQARRAGREEYGAHLHATGDRSPLAVSPVLPEYADDAETLNGFEVLNRAFDAAFARLPHLVAFGEDVGQLGDVNQGMAGLQAKYGPLRVSDTGIRETTILGQAIGMAMRGLRPIAEIQYLDYLLYALQIVSDDLATLRWRSAGGQMAPVVVRTRGHRLEGIWHSGSPMAGILGLVRGVWVCVPRDMTRAAGFYNTLLAGDDPGLVVEVLNGYRAKERLPSNLAEMRLPLGVPEVLREGRDVTVVTYGACCRIAAEAAEQLARLGIEVELIDVQTLLPFDRPGTIVDSLRKTGRVVFLDEDVPGGTTAYMLERVVAAAGGFWWLDAPPVTVSARPHRPAYGSDGDYFSKPNREDVFDAVYGLMHEAAPRRFPRFTR